jgi:hypothetical protein
MPVELDQIRHFDSSGSAAIRSEDQLHSTIVARQVDL